MKKHCYLVLLFVCILSVIGNAQDNFNSQKIEWLTFEEAMTKNKKAPRKIIIDVYTEWCGWCKYMDKTTFVDPAIISYINANYYAVKLDAETLDTILFKGKKYGPLQPYAGNGRKPTHALAYELLRGQMSYPNLLYMDDSSNVITAIPGYKSPKDLQAFLIFFAENLYKYNDINKFIKDFENTFTDSLREKSEKIKWLTVKEANEKQKNEKRKLFINVQTEWSPTCKIMDNCTFNNPKIAEYINTKCYPVRLNSTSKDTIIFNNYTFINENKEHPFHQFAVTLLNGKMQFPNFVFFDLNWNVISAVPGYMTAEGIEPIIKYFMDDVYQTTKWEEFIKSFNSNLHSK